jgi:hypothetical protein
MLPAEVRALATVGAEFAAEVADLGRQIAAQQAKMRATGKWQGERVAWTAQQRELAASLTELEARRALLLKERDDTVRAARKKAAPVAKAWAEAHYRQHVVPAAERVQKALASLDATLVDMRSKSEPFARVAGLIGEQLPEASAPEMGLLEVVAELRQRAGAA